MKVCTISVNNKKIIKQGENLTTVHDVQGKFDKSILNSVIF
jgi:hypothetical protein